MGDIIIFLYLKIDNEVYCVIVDGKEIGLILKEYDLFYYLVRFLDKVFDCEFFLKEVWCYEFFGDLWIIDIYVKRFCEKLYDVLEDVVRMIVIVWGFGYKFEVLED